MQRPQQRPAQGEGEHLPQLPGTQGEDEPLPLGGGAPPQGTHQQLQKCSRETQGVPGSGREDPEDSRAVPAAGDGEGESAAVLLKPRGRERAVGGAEEPVPGTDARRVRRVQVPQQLLQAPQQSPPRPAGYPEAEGGPGQGQPDAQEPPQAVPGRHLRQRRRPPLQQPPLRRQPPHPPHTRARRRRTPSCGSGSQHCPQPEHHPAGQDGSSTFRLIHLKPYLKFCITFHIPVYKRDNFQGEMKYVMSIFI